MGNRFTWAKVGQVSRGEPLGPVRLNQTDANTRWNDDLQRVEHFANGEHNALEVPWVLGHVDGTTGYMFDTGYGGGTIANPATGQFAVSVASGVMTLPAAAVLVNLNDEAIANKPHTVSWEGVSDTSIKVYTRELSVALTTGGNTWAAVDRDFDIAVHAPPQAAESSDLNSFSPKLRRDFLTEAATDYNALAQNTAIAYSTATLEHTSAGLHSVNRIAKAVWWGRPSAGPSFTTTLADGVKSITYNGTGDVTVETDYTFNSISKMACFPQPQPSAAGEMVIVNGRAVSQTSFRFYTYVYSGGNWDRADRPIFAAMFGEP